MIETPGGTSALRLFKNGGQRINLLLTDAIMPHMSGSELADAARAHQPDLKVLHTSGYTRDAIMRDGKLDAGVELLAKPFTYAMLANIAA